MVELLQLLAGFFIMTLVALMLIRTWVEYFWNDDDD